MFVGKYIKSSVSAFSVFIRFLKFTVLEDEEVLEARLCLGILDERSQKMEQGTCAVEETGPSVNGVIEYEVSFGHRLQC